jgi:2-polyprenyl-3-methyl-5-hydroxy-6-metoxy-1,4-benzoquinol methylase
MNLESRYFTYLDKQLKQMDDFYVPDEWWSRGYEYHFAAQFLNKNDIILDAACGIEHPFKLYASKRVKICYAIDIDERIEQLEGNDKLIYKRINLNDIENNFEPESFDKIFCLSVFEHIPEHALKVLKNFKELIKPDGYIVMTLDHPFMKTSDIVSLVNAVGLQFVSGMDYDIPKNAIKGPYNGLKCYSALLTKSEYTWNEQEHNVIVDLDKVIVPKEKKPTKPKETK